MNRLVLCLLVGMLAPLPGIAQTRPPEVTTVVVNVTNGSGSGTFDAARTMHVWADAPGTGRVFDRWSGDIDALVDPLAAHTTILTSQTRGTVNLTANYLSALTWTAATEPFNGVTLSTYFPPGPLSGVITLHHGSGGSGANFFNRPEYRSFCEDAAARGYGLVALDSLDRVNKQWDPTVAASNVDIQNVQAALTLLISRGLMTASTPRFALGMSNGGGFTSKIAYFLGYAAADSYCAQASNGNISNVPIMWNMAMNDGNEMVGPVGNSQALVNFGNMAARGVPASVAQNAPAPVYPNRFARIPGLTTADSSIIFQSIKAAGFLDANNFLTAPPSTSGVQSAIPIAYLLQASTIVDSLSGSYTEHQFFSDANHRTLQFLANPTNVGALNPRLINLSTRGQVLAGENVLIGGLVIQGGTATTKRLLVRAVGPTLAGAGVTGVLNDPTLAIYNAAGAVIASSDDWRVGTQATEIAASGFAPVDDREPAVILNLAPGAYTAIVSGKGGATGVALIEAYDLETPGVARLANVSTRGRVGAGENVMIGGLVIGGQVPKRMLLRALGPSLGASGVTGVLTDPVIELRGAGGQLLAIGDDWQTGLQAQEILASRFVPGDARDAVLVAWLAPGAYTIIVRGKSGGEGVALVEAYELF